MGNEIEASKYLARPASVETAANANGSLKWSKNFVPRSREKQRSSPGSQCQQENRFTNKQSQISWVACLNRCSSRSRQRL